MDRMIEFRKVINITKATEGDDGELYIEGESTGPELDLDKQFMTPTCIQGMADQIAKSPLPYLDEHQKRGVLTELGTVIQANVTPQYHLQTKTRLDKSNPAAVHLWQAVRKGKKYGQSIAGHVAELAHKAIDGVVYKGFNRIVLDHIANTTKPSWAPSLGTLVAKSLESEGFDWADTPEYEGDLELPFSAHVEKRSKPDPQAGKGYLLIEDVLKRLNTLFGWGSYQDRIDEINRDVIPLTDLPIAATLPVGAISLSTGDFEKDPDSYIQKMMAEMPPAMSGKAYDIKQLATLYQELYYIADSLQRRDAKTGKKGGKKAVTKLRAAMAAVADAMKEVLSKSQPPPEPLTYGEPIVPAQPAPAPIVAPHLEGDNVVRSFTDAATVGQMPAQALAPPQPVQHGPAITDFSQVADTAPVAMPVAKSVPDGGLAQLLAELGDAVTKTFEANAPVDDKRNALVHIVKAFMAEVGGRLEEQRPEEDRIAKAVAKAVGPLVEKVSQLEAQLAVAKSQPATPPPTQGDEPPLVRKSIPGRNVEIQPARIIQKGDRRPTFFDSDQPWAQPSPWAMQ